MISYLSERYFADVPQVGSLPLEVGMGLVPDDEDNVGGNLVGGLVALALEGDLGARLPARLDVDGQHFLLLLGRPVVADHPPRYLHPLSHPLNNTLLLETKLSF